MLLKLISYVGEKVISKSIKKELKCGGCASEDPTIIYSKMHLLFRFVDFICKHKKLFNELGL